MRDCRLDLVLVRCLVYGLFWACCFCVCFFLRRLWLFRWSSGHVGLFLHVALLVVSVWGLNGVVFR